MSPNKTKKLVEWLELTRPNQQYNLDDIKELLSIAMAELDDQKDKSFESLPGAYAEAIIEDLKSSREYYRLDDKIERFKSRFIQGT